MSVPEFPPNSDASKRGGVRGKKIERVTSGDVTRRRKSLRKQFSSMFVAGDLRNSAQWAVIDVFLPLARDMIVETIQQGVERLFLGDSRRRSSRYPLDRAPIGRINYTQYASSSLRQSGPQRAISRQARARHDFDEIVLDDRVEAEDVLDKLFEVVDQYESATVADLYELVGLTASHTDNKWGWTDLSGAGVSRIRGGYLLDLPVPEPLD